MKVSSHFLAIIISLSFIPVNDIFAQLDPPGNALYFSGIQYGEIVNPSNLPNYSITIEAWIKLQSFKPWASIVERYVNEDWGSFSFGLDETEGNKLMFQWNNVAYSWSNRFSGNIVLKTGEWYHVAVISNGDSASLYVNGIEDTRADVDSLGEWGNLLIGASFCGGDEYFDGQIDEFRIWNYARTQEDINNTMYNVIDPGTPGLVTYYGFDGEGADSTLSDLTSSANHAMLLNYPSWVESYAMVVPVATNATNVQYYQFTANWTQPVIGIVDGYYLDVTTDPNFSAMVPGYDGLYIGDTTSKIISPLNSGQTYFYRVRAQKLSAGQGGNSNTILITTSSFFTETSISFPGILHDALALGDYDNDGDLDVLLLGIDSLWNTVTKIYRNDGGNIFTDISATLIGVYDGAIDWGDYDNDGDLDILLTGAVSEGIYTCKIYRNDREDNFVDISTTIPGTESGSASWGDYDNDGDLDILLTGYHYPDYVSKIYRNDGEGIFTEAASLAGVWYSSAVWGDYDNDGDLDILLTGLPSSGTPSAKIYRNDGGGSFTDINAVISGVFDGIAVWGDYDSDGDLDILLTGNAGEYSPTSIVYQNNSGGSFTDIAAPLMAVLYSSAAWGDYDNDGDLDILLAGDEGEGAIKTKVYRNDGGGTFTDIRAQLKGILEASVAWGDHDNDGDLDIFLTGGAVAKVYRNNNGTSNTVPTAPAGLSISKLGTSVVLSWNKSTDAQTPQDGLTYNLRMGTTPGGSQICSPMADNSTGFRQIPKMGNTNHRNSWAIANLPSGTYYWSAQAIDNAFAGSSFSTEQTVVVDNPPVAPRLESVDDGNEQVTLKWKKSRDSDFLRYRIYADTFSNPTTQIDSSTSISDTSKTITGLINGLVYYFRLTAVDIDLNESGFSNELSTTPALFSDISAKLANVYTSSAAWGDYDSDGDLDILLTGFTDTGAVSKVYRNDGEGKFVDISVPFIGVAEGSVAWFDYDNDGDLDVLLTGGDTWANPTTKIYRNDGQDSFTDISASLIAVRFSAVACGDYDNDGDPDILVSGYGTSWNRVAKVYRNNGDGVFTDIFAPLTGVSYSTADWGDYDNDGDLDILLSGNTDSNNISKVYRNDDGITFTDISAPLVGIQGGSAEWGDYDNDGDLDILLIGSGMSIIYHNDGGGVFTDIGASLTGVSGASGTWGDYENDGDLDILLSGAIGEMERIAKVYRNNGGGTFVDISAHLEGTESGSSEWGDYDNDGDLDILTTGISIAKIYRNNIGPVSIIPLPPRLGAPLNSALINNPGIMLRWYLSSIAHRYYLQIATDPNFSNIIFKSDTIKSSSQYVSGLTNNTYYWRVQAICTFGSSEWSDVRLFSVIVISKEYDLSVNANNIQLSTIDTSCTISATINNLMKSVKDVEVRFAERDQVNNTEIQIGNIEIIDSIGQGSSIVLNRSYQPHSPVFQIVVHIDPSFKIYEQTKFNNIAAREFRFTRPVINSVSALYGESKDIWGNGIIGTFLHRVEGTANTFTANLSGNIKKVEFTLNGKTIIDDNAGGGWTADFDMGILPVGIHDLVVKATSSENITSIPFIRRVVVGQFPEFLKWLSGLLKIGDNISGGIKDGYFVLEASVFDFKPCQDCQQEPDPDDTSKIRYEEESFGYAAKPKEDAFAFPKDQMSSSSELLLTFRIPLDPRLQPAISGRYIYKQKMGSKEVSNLEFYLRGVIKQDWSSLDSLFGGFQTEILLYGYEYKMRYMPYPAIVIFVGGGVDLGASLKIGVVCAVREGNLQFVKTAQDEKTHITPGLYLRINLVAGVEILFGVASAQIILSPQFNLNFEISYVNYPVSETKISTVLYGTGEVNLRVIASLLWYRWELYKTRWGPWLLFNDTLSNRTFSKNAYTYSDSVILPEILPLPSISTSSQGDVMVAWTATDTMDGMTPQIYYAYKSSSPEFSAPAAIVNNSSYKSSPQIVFNPDGTASAVWVQNSLDSDSAENITTVSDILRYQDIYYSVWDRTNWAPPIRVNTEQSLNEKSDGVPTVIISPSGDKKLVLWTRNMGDSAMDRPGLEIYYSAFSEGSFSPMRSIHSKPPSSQYADLMVRGCYYNDSDAIALWIRDLNAEDSIDTDYNIFYSVRHDTTWSEPEAVTSELSSKSALSVAALKNNLGAIAAWIETNMQEDSTFTYSLITSMFEGSSWSSPELIYQSHHYMETPILNVDKRNIATATWRGYYKEINGDVLVALKDYGTPNGRWTEPKAVTNDGLIDWMIATAIDTLGNQYFVDLKSATQQSPIGIQSLSNFHGGLTMNVRGIRSASVLSEIPNVGSFFIAPDLMIDSSSFSVIDSTLKENTTSDLFITIRNIGGIASQSSKVRIYNGHPLFGGAPIGPDINIPSISPDTSIIIQTPYLFTVTNSIYAKVDPDSTIEEQSETNNLAGRNINLLADLTVTDLNINPYPAPSLNQDITVNVTVKNVGQMTTSTLSVQLLESTTDTNSIPSVWSSTTLYNLQPDSSYTIVKQYLPIRKGTTVIYSRLDPQSVIPEIDETNNNRTSQFSVLPDIRVDALYYDSTAATLVNIITNAGGDTAQAFNIGYYIGEPRLGGLKIGNQFIQKLLPDESDTIRLAYSVPVGVSDIYCMVDSVSVLMELSKVNNLAVVTVLFRATVDLEPGIFHMASFYPIGMNRPVLCTVSNIGSLEANYIAYQAKFRSAVDSIIVERSIASLKSNSSRVDTLYYNFKDTTGIDFEVIVDPDDSIAESNEINNMKTISLYGYVNRPPHIVSSPVESVYVDSLYSYRLIVEDADTSYGEIISFDFQVLEWLTFDTSQRVFSGIPSLLDTGSYLVSIIIHDRAGESDSQYFRITVTETPTDVDTEQELPADYSLAQCYPNPFNPKTIVKYQLPVESRVELNIFNVLGELVATLVDDIQAPGNKMIEWDGSNVASGVYFYRLEAVSIAQPGRTFSNVKKMILVK